MGDKVVWGWLIGWCGDGRYSGVGMGDMVVRGWVIWWCGDG